MKLVEKFVTYHSLEKYKEPWSSAPSTLIIFKNPTSKEWKEVAEGARGYVSPDGDLYIEGYDEPARSSLIHIDFLEILSEYLPIPKVMFTRKAGTLYFTSYYTQFLQKGMCVVRDGYSTIALAESYEYDKILENEKVLEDATTLWDKVHNNCPYLDFHLVVES